MKELAEDTNLIDLRKAFNMMLQDLFEKKEEFIDRRNYLKQDITNRIDNHQPSYEAERELKEVDDKLETIKYVLDVIIEGRLSEYDIELEEED